MPLKESTRKYILVGVVLFIIIGLLSAKVLASKQDKAFQTEDALLQQASQAFGDEKPADAAVYIDKLLKKQPDSEIANYLGGLIAAGNEKYGKASVLMQKALDLNPHKVEDAMFMLQLGEVLVSAEQFEQAKIVLARCEEAGWAPEGFPTYQARVKELQKKINEKQ